MSCRSALLLLLTWIDTLTHGPVNQIVLAPYVQIEVGDEYDDSFTSAVFDYSATLQGSHSHMDKSLPDANVLMWEGGHYGREHGFWSMCWVEDDDESAGEI